MKSMTRRGVVGMGVMSMSAFLGAGAPAGDEKAADEKPVRFKIKDVTIEKVNQAARTVNVHFGKPGKPVKMIALPLAEEIHIRVSFIFPGVVNNVPFHWDRLKQLVGRRVSMQLIAHDNGLAVDAIATAND
jgi:hypothetical protein